MTLRTIALVGLAALVLATGAVAAVPTNAQHANDTRRADGRSPADGERGPAAAGPPIDVPDVVPDRVAAIHRTIQSFLAGDLSGSLGEALQDLLGTTDAPQGSDGTMTTNGGATTSANATTAAGA
ncbi:MAG: hypothetical protein ABEJ77_04970 [Halanaeroarchaeum sp.]